ncbi:MAG TPA: hypothetical protein VM325_02715 [Alphaproteobacteria bacterium]|nr:hypothetical protein [Alphaproteobacteria bacterium]
MPRSFPLFAALLVLSTCLAVGPATAETAAAVMPPLTSRWSGTITEYRDGEIKRRIPIEVSFDDPRGPITRYPSFKCRGRLTLLQALQGVYAYTERIEQGRCRSGAAVLFVIKKGKLIIDREHVRDPVRIIISGPLSRVDSAAR